MKAGWSPGNNDEVSMFNLTVFQIFYWMVGKVWKLRPVPLKKNSLKVHTLKKFFARRNYFTFFPAALCAVKHLLYTSNLLPTPMLMSSVASNMRPRSHRKYFPNNGVHVILYMWWPRTQLCSWNSSMTSTSVFALQSNHVRTSAVWNMMK